MVTVLAPLGQHGGFGLVHLSHQLGVSGDLLTYQGAVYRVVQSHTSASHWTPDTVPSLYAPA